MPPVLLFTNTGNWRDVQFQACGAGAWNLWNVTATTAIWKLKNGKRFQNYQSKFTVLCDRTNAEELDK